MKNYFFFRGNRNYIHGADILAAVVKHFQIHPINGFDYLVSQPALTCFTFAEYSDELKSQAVAHYKDSIQNVLIIPTTEPVASRIPDSEQDIKAGVSITENTATIDEIFDGVSPYRYAVIIFKALLEKINFEQDIKYKFVRLILKKELPEHFSITYSRMVGGSFFEGIIMASEVELGKIYFGRG